MKLINKVNCIVYKYSVLISVIYAATLFVAIFDTAILHPTYIDWLYIYGGDAVQHQVGWEAFRNAPWRFPIGLLDNVTYPEPISIIFTDFILVFAVFSKYCYHYFQ